MVWTFLFLEEGFQLGEGGGRWARALVTRSSNSEGLFVGPPIKELSEEGWAHPPPPATPDLRGPLAWDVRGWSTDPTVHCPSVALAILAFDEVLGLVLCLLQNGPDLTIWELILRINT